MDNHDSSWFTMRALPRRMVSLASRAVRRITLRNERKLVRDSVLFDPAYYLENHPYVARARIDPLDHFLSKGGRTLNPHPLFDSAWYLSRYPDVANSGANPLVHYLLHGWKEHRWPSPLFDGDFYLAANPDIPRGTEPLSHYLQVGALAGRDPHPLFNGAFYTSQCPELQSAQINPLVHYLTRGWRNRRNPHPLFDVAFYLNEYTDIQRSGREPLQHYLVEGSLEKRNPHPLFDTHFYLERHPELVPSGVNPLVHFVMGKAGDPNRYFDVGFYSKQTAELLATGADAVLHYLKYGAEQGLNPHPLFDTRWYSSKNPSVANSGENPLLHFLRTRVSDPRDPHPLFDTKFYLEQNAYILTADVSPVDHYLYSGGIEGRDPHPLFDSDWYLAQIPDARDAEENPLLHYLVRGWKEKRSPCAMFDGAFYLEQNPDVAEGSVSSLHHYLVRGAAEGRDPNRWFDTDWYVSQTPEIVPAGWNPLVHYVLLGARQGRRTRAANEENASPHFRRRPRQRIVFVSGEPETPGHHYRVANIANSLAPKFFDTLITTTAEIWYRLNEITTADLVWVWRARLTPQMALLVSACREAGIALVYDVDDLMFRRELATTDFIDAIRSQNLSESGVQRFYEQIRQLLLKADRCTTPTTPLAQEIRQLDKPATVIPNGFDRTTLERARSIVRTHRSRPGDGLIRIGYAAGTLTHQKDLSAASRALARVLTEHANSRLVLFREAVALNDFPELRAVQDQIEWRELVPVAELPSEYARFDINIAPLEAGNPYCEAKSELKFFEAALVHVPTIASPTRPFAEAIHHAHTGLLARNNDEWYAHLTQLVSDPALRRRIAKEAYQEVLWRYGPERRSLLVTRLVNEMLATGPLRFDLFRFEMQASDSPAALPSIAIPEYDVLFQSSSKGVSRVSVIVPLYNYAGYLVEALDSILQQTVRDIDVIVVDDQSTDHSAEVAQRWLEQHASRFNLVALLQNRQNSKLARTRNAGIGFSETELYMALDADNALLPDCLESCMRWLDETGAAFAYPTISLFGERHGQIGLLDYDPAQFQCINYIDAMAMVRKACWIAVGGYTPLEPVGWEDYEFWCKLAEKGLYGVRVPETTARYRTHGTSMLRTVTDVPDKKKRAIEDMNRRHPWLQLRVPEGDVRTGERARAAGEQPN